MSSKLWDANPLIVALFDLPAGVQAHSNSNTDLRSNIDESQPKRQDTGDTDNASLLYGENISYFADQDCSSVINPPRPLLFASYFPTFGPPFGKLPSLHNTHNIIATSHKKKKKKRADKNAEDGKRSGREKTSDTTAPSYVDDIHQLPNIAQHDSILNELLSLDRVTNLQLKMQRIRLSIHSLERELMETRSELVRAHKQLHFAVLELDDVKRAAFQADLGLFQLAQQQQQQQQQQHHKEHYSSTSYSYNNMSARSSTCSNSTDRMHYFSPRSTLDGDESISSSTPRSISSYDSFYSSNEVDTTNANSFQEHVRISMKDKDKTPLKRNGKLKQIFLTDATTDISREESSSVCPFSTVASLQEDTGVDQSESMTNSGQSRHEGQRDKNMCRYESFIRAHDLRLSGDADHSTIVSLQTTDVADVANALFQKGYECAMDESERWTPEQGTGKLLSKRASNRSKNVEMDGPMGDWPNAAYGDEVLVWTSKCIHGGHGSEYPMVKARGLVPTSALKMVELLLDSDRVKEYNKMSLGRIDEHRFAIGVERLAECPSTGILGELKIVRSKSQPPVVRKPIELRLLLHARRLSSEEGSNTSNYLTIGRSIWETEQGTAADTDENSVTRCEMLLSVNLIRDIPSYNSEWCEITTITHGISPGIPISIGKRIGLAAAAKYIRDIRAVFVK